MCMTLDGIIIRWNFREAGVVERETGSLMIRYYPRQQELASSSRHCFYSWKVTFGNYWHQDSTSLTDTGWYGIVQSYQRVPFYLSLG